MENIITMIYIASFILLVAVIALVTNRLNAKTPCEHDWQEHDHSFKCCKCGKKIPDYTAVYADQHNSSFSEAA
ncbi:MAG TPA: hypothetical protein VHC47_12895 [Mucilaginibacter sp.]|nr:hypothetical protein [Mucilaginibacter sp.]